MAELKDLRKKIGKTLSDEEFLLRAVMPANLVDAMQAAGPAERHYDPAKVPIMSEATQALCFLAGANSIFTGDKLLTAPNAGDDADAALFAKLGLVPLAGEEPMRACAKIEAAE